jgi:hypothetical protein
MQRRWNVSTYVSSSHPLPQILVILGFIAIFFIGVPLWFIGRGLSVWCIIFGIVIMLIGIFLWMYEKEYI